MKVNKKIKEFIDIAKGKKHPPLHIYKSFQKMRPDDKALFQKNFGFYVTEIDKIGFEKFVKANGWTRKEHVTKWKTDMIHNIICPACKDDFGRLEECAGLCDSCKPNFWFDLIPEADILLSAIDTSDEIISSIALFITEASYRDLFKKTSDIATDSADNDFLQLVLIANLLNGMFARNEIAVDITKETNEKGEEVDVRIPVFIGKELDARAVEYKFKRQRIYDCAWFMKKLNKLVALSGAARTDGNVNAIPLMHYLERIIAEEALKNIERKEVEIDYDKRN